METLSDFFIEKLRTELNETETRKEQSIKQFYEWLSKHPFVKKCKIEQFEVIIMLRAAKYNMNKVYDNFNKSILYQQNNPQLFDFNISKLLEIYDKGAIQTLINRNSDGQRIVILRHEIFDKLKIDINSILQIILLVSVVLMEEPETVIAGVVIVMDYTDITMRYVNIIDMNSLGRFVKFGESTCMKPKKIYVVGLPKIANSFLEILKPLLSDKIRSRLNLVKNRKDLVKFVGEENLTAEYGGSVNLEDCLKYFRSQVESMATKLATKVKSVEVDEKMMRKYENENIFEGVGSFRKLEVD